MNVETFIAVFVALALGAFSADEPPGIPHVDGAAREPRIFRCRMTGLPRMRAAEPQRPPELPNADA